ncbi:DNA phosphorothioation-dependent restriction protein DptH [Priestia abyssalis]|uniref:DNA phosphorothioation-dependent restriction protein DptH n=1 Tax=Priestia abyssalis TaxID=1221450 RepID=UPI0009954416|nr:DNA phosphorothioation-dependent restriction protein DptH [Priestia abyssalis]
MLNQFYNYLSEKLIGYLQNEPLRGGERFYLQFDNEEQVESFYRVLEESEASQPFHYRHEHGSPYSTISIKISENIKVVVAATSENVTPDFLVTLRNQVGEQKGVWENTALLSICHETLDSIRGGSSDLQKEGMPFNVKSILKTLKEDIEASSLKKEEKEVLSFYLRKKLDDVVLQPSLWDYEEILGFLVKKEIAKADYPNLGLFYDENLNQYTSAQMKKRLEENYGFYEKVQHLHEYEYLENQLEKLFDDKGVQRLKKDDWKEADYTLVKDSHEKLIVIDKPLEYIESTKKKSKEGLVFWEKAQGDTKAGQRKRHLIVFNLSGLEQINIGFEFNERLKKDYIHKNCQDVCEVSGKKLFVSLSHQPKETSFHKVVYTHKMQSKSKYEFNIIVVSCEPSLLQSIQTLYEVNVSQKKLILNKREESIVLGDGVSQPEEVFIEEEEQVVQYQSGSMEISGSSSAWNDDTLSFTLRLGETSIPILIKEQVARTVPVFGNRVWKLKREYEESFEYNEETNKLKQGAREFSAREEFRKYLMDEKEWIQNEIAYAERGLSGLKKIVLPLNESLAAAYEALISYYKVNDTVPSLAFMDDKLRELSIRYLDEFNASIAHIEENTMLKREEKNLFKLGVIHEGQRTLLTPLHPLNVAYQLTINDELKGEQIDMHILNRLHPNNLLPYVYGEDDRLYRPIVQSDAPEWMVYEPLQQVAIGESNAFLSSVVEEKLNQFVEHFQYLFLEDSKSPIRINVININNDKEVVRGLMNFIRKQLEKKGLSKIIPVEVTLYQESDVFSDFERFSIYDEVEKFEEAFDMSLGTKNLDAVDVLRLVRENVLYYKSVGSEEYGHAHISFYKMVSNERHAKNTMDDIETGLSLNGLLSSLSSVKTEEDYRTGFGVKNVLDTEHLLIRTAWGMNELASNLNNDGTNPYRKNETIVTRTSNYDERVLNQLYDSSYWVTFIEPSVGLDFFQSSSRDLLIIHYSDQYSSSTQYDAITVTDKTKQYQAIIEQYLTEKSIVATPEKIDTAIRAFNSLNGEWLLRIIGSKGQFSREKLSIISAIKYILSTLDHKNILWIPISLEEVLRVAGTVKLTKSEGVFSAKNLGVKGAHSDDLLLIGVEVGNGRLFVHYYPVEVKIGLNQESTIVKAKEQIGSTRLLFDTQLSKVDEDGKKVFKHKFFRNFFVQLLLSNTEKFIANRIWPEKDYGKIDSLKARLLNDDYEISQHLNPIIGKGAILSFKTEQTWRSIKNEDDILLLELTEEDGYSGVAVGMEELKMNIQSGNTDINPEVLLGNRYGGYNEEKKVSDMEPPEPVVKPPIPAVENDLNDIRVLLGTIEGSMKKIYWEFGHRELANRHILISGKSGQGKSYFIQCLLLELAQNGISSIIFDYTDGFKNSKLEPEFKEQLQGNIEQFLVAKDKFPINPFKRNQKELDEGIYIDEDNTDVAERIKSVFSAIYKDLGIQQQNAIYEAVIRGLDKHGENMSLELLLEELDDDSSGPARTAKSQIKPLIDKSPFNHESQYNWGELLNEKGKVFIVQLTGFNRDVQLMITEFILWDIWNHQLHHGDKNKPFPVILDEAQNLDHREKSPSAKILTEGRKFGWSGWYATQSLKGQFTTDEISRLQNSSQKVYFMPPENEISSIAANLAQDASARKEWEKRLATLKKGQCIAFGPILEENDTLKQGVPLLINISSLQDRLNNK